MTTSQRVPRRALLRRVGPWIVLAALLTGCASPAVRTAIETLEGQCADQARGTAACQTLVAMVQDAPTVAGAGPAIASAGAAIASVATSSTRAAARTAEKRGTKERRTETTRRSSKPKAQAKPRQRTETKPRRATRRVPRVRMPSNTSSYFGAGVTLARFRITGDTRSQILRSIRSRGPHGGAQGVTQPYLRYRFTFKYDRKGRCRIAKTGSSAVTMSFRVTLPAWTATSGTDHTTASWWAGELRDTAAHERQHVRLWKGALRQANRVVATSSCRRVAGRLDAVWRKAIVANCRYDSSQYGISMRACLRR